MIRPTEQPLDTLAFSLMRELVTITSESWVTAARFTKIADLWDFEDPTARVRLLMGLRKLVQSMPVKVFPDMEARRTILQAAQEALDRAIEVEEGLE